MIFILLLSYDFYFLIFSMTLEFIGGSAFGYIPNCLNTTTDLPLQKDSSMLSYALVSALTVAFALSLALVSASTSDFKWAQAFC